MPTRRVQVDITARDKSKAAFSSLQASARRTQAVFSSVGASLKGIFLPLAGAAGVTAIVRETSRAMNELDLIAKRARTAGLGTDIFQALGLAAEEANVQQSLLNSSLLAFVKRVGEAKAGVGPLVSGLKNADANLLKLLQGTRNQKDALLLLADAISGAETATDKARIANAAFGRSGIEMVRILNLSGDGLLETAEKAKKLGLIYDKDLLRRQEKLNNDLGVFNKVIGVQFKSILVQLAPVLTTFAGKVADAARWVRELFDAANVGSSSSILELKKRINEINDELDSPESKRGAARNRLVRELEQRTEELKAATSAMRAIRQTVNVGGKSDFGGSTAAPSFDPIDVATKKVATVTRATKPLQLFRKELTATKRESQVMSEAFSIGMSTVENAISDLVSTGKVNFKSLISSMLSDFARLASSNLFRSLGSSVLGAGGLSSLFGGGGAVGASGGLRFGGLFADGGKIKSGEFGIVGEKGPEFVQGPANVTPMTSGGGGVTVNINNPNFAGADAVAVPAIEAKLNDLRRELPAIIMSTLANQRRYKPGAA